MMEFPNHWTQTTLRRILKRMIEKNQPNLPLLSVVRERGVVPRSLDKNENPNAVPQDLSGYLVVKKGQFAVNKMKAWQGSYGVSELDGVISPAYYVFDLRFDGKEFFHRAMRSCYYAGQFAALSIGIRVGQWDLPIPKMKDIVFYYPPRDEQDQIVRWLEWRISHINKLVRSKRREIECLKELKNAIISTAVTQGINANVNMKDSGVKWLGTIPTHWQVSTIKKHFRIKKNIAGSEGYNVLSITQHGLKVKNVKSNEGQIAQDYSGYQFVNPGDFAMNHMDLITGYVDYSKIHGVTSPDYRVFQLRNDSEDSPEYFLKLLQNCYHRRIFYTFGRGAAEKGRWRLPRENFEAFDIPVPPFEEQEAIADYLKKKCKEIDDLSLKLRKEISLVEEYKTRIISDAVTGKIDLRDIEVPNYEAVEDESATADDENGTEEDLGDDEN